MRRLIRVLFAGLAGCALGSGVGCGSATELWLNVPAGTGGTVGTGGGTPSIGGTVGTGGAIGTGGTPACYACAQLLSGIGTVDSACTNDGPPTATSVIAEVADCACKPGICQGPCHAFCDRTGAVRDDCTSCLDKACGPELDACDANHGTGGTGGTGGSPSGGSGGTAGTGGVIGGTGGTTGGTGGTTGGTGGTTGGTGGTGGTPATGGYAGAPVTGTACEKRHIARGNDPLLDDFEQDLLGAEPGNFGNHDGIWGGVYSYDDLTGTRSFAVVADGHTGQGANFTLTGYRLWGGGWGLWVSCVDVSVYGGISFWAKGSDGDVVQVLFGNPASMSTQDGGTCADTNCTAPSFRIRLTSAYRQYSIRWGDIRPGSGGAFDPRVLTSIGWHLENPNYGRSHDGWFTIDEVRLLGPN